jgi:hypothetical protein
MTRPRLFVVMLTVALALGVAGVALADSAGDNQYQDPFGNTAPQSTAPQTTPAPAPRAPAVTPSQPAATSQAASSQPAATGQLPRTGLDLRLVGGLGVLLVAAGVLLRRRLA